MVNRNLLNLAVNFNRWSCSCNLNANINFNYRSTTPYGKELYYKVQVIKVIAIK